MAADPAVYLSTEEVAAILHIEPATVRDKARRGELPRVKEGRRWLFPRDAVLALLAERTQGVKGRTAAPTPPIALPVPPQRVTLPDGAETVILFPNASWRTDEELAALAAPKTAPTKRRRSR